MPNGDRLSSTYMTENKRPGHNFGNVLVLDAVKKQSDQTFERAFVNV